MKNAAFKYEVAANIANELGEGPVWDDLNRRLFWVNILKGEIHWLYPASGQHAFCAVGHPVGTIVIADDGRILAALKNGFAYVNLATAQLETITDPEGHLPRNRFNDGKCDTAGRFWAGTMSMENEPNAGALYTLATDFTVTKKINNVGCSNGLAWSPDNTIFYFTDTNTQQVWAYDYDAESGDIKNKRVILSFSDDDGWPDGMTIDTEGMLWIAFWDGWKVERRDPLSGKLLATITLPVSRPTSCTFGGENLQDLYITTASLGLSTDELKKQPLAGNVFVVKQTGCAGLPLNYFKRTNGN